MNPSREIFIKTATTIPRFAHNLTRQAKHSTQPYTSIYIYILSLALYVSLPEYLPNIFYLLSKLYNLSLKRSTWPDLFLKREILANIFCNRATNFYRN